MLALKQFGLIITAFMLIAAPASAKNDKEKPLPPGLEKKLKSGKSLPPGWQKKVAVGQVLDAQVYEQAKVILRDNGLETLNVEGKIIRVLENTREVVEILQGL